jgi:predicted nucleic acid-binding protein
MHLATSGLFRAKWTEEIQTEWIRNLLLNRPDLSEEQLHRTRDLMNEAVPDCLVTGYGNLVGAVTLPDPGDRHVLAAAIRGRADVIVTMNLRDFPKSELEPYGIDAQHPDQFIVHLLDLQPERVYEAAKQQRANLRNPPKSPTELLEAYERQGLAQTVSRLRDALGLF